MRPSLYPVQHSASPLVQSAQGVFQATTFAPVRFPGANTAGNLLIVSTGVFSNGSYTTSTVTDTAGNTYTLLGFKNDGVNSFYVDLWVCLSAKSYVAGNVVSATGNGNTINTGLIGIAEFQTAFPFPGKTWITEPGGVNQYEPGQPTVTRTPVVTAQELSISAFYASAGTVRFTPDQTPIVNAFESVNDTCMLLEWALTSAQTGQPVTSAPQLNPISNAFGVGIITGFYTR
jgi:hypothetical protein